MCTMLFSLEMKIPYIETEETGTEEIESEKKKGNVEGSSNTDQEG